MSTLSTIPWRWVVVKEKPSSELLQSFLLQVMGLRELDTTSLEGTLDQDREDSGENLNIAPTTVYLLSGVSICPENLISSWPHF